MATKSSDFKEAPPINPPSTSGFEKMSEALSGLTLPPYRMETSSATEAS